MATYPHDGQRTVVLTVTDNAGATNSITKTITIGGAAPPPLPPPPVNAPPVASFTWSCSGLTCTLNASSSTDDVGIVSYSWNLGRFPDPTTTGQIATVTYPHSGSRVVTLTVTDNAGATSSVTKTITM